MNTHKSPCIVLVMGVSGCGKSTVAQLLADRLGAEYIEADDFHSEQAKMQMAAGISLTDEQRLPWIQALCKKVKVLFMQNKKVILACSLLRREHREQFYQLGLPLTLLYLKGDKSLIYERLGARRGHYFPAQLLDKQFEDLQPPKVPEPLIELEITDSVEMLVERAFQRIVGS